jgi:hypothetical protein
MASATRVTKFMRVLGRRISLRVTRAHREVPATKPMQQFTGAALMQVHAKCALASTYTDEKHGVRSWLDGLGNLRQMQVHCHGVAMWQDECGPLPSAGQMAPKM